MGFNFSYSIEQAANLKFVVSLVIWQTLLILRIKTLLLFKGNETLFKRGWEFLSYKEISELPFYRIFEKGNILSLNVKVKFIYYVILVFI